MLSAKKMSEVDRLFTEQIDEDRAKLDKAIAAYCARDVENDIDRRLELKGQLEAARSRIATLYDALRMITAVNYGL